MACVPCIALGTALVGGGGIMTSNNFSFYVASLIITLIALYIYAYSSFINECNSCNPVNKDDDEDEDDDKS